MKRLASSLYCGETFFYDDNAEVVYENETASLSPTLAQSKCLRVLRLNVSLITRITITSHNG